MTSAHSAANLQLKIVPPAAPQYDLGLLRRPPPFGRFLAMNYGMCLALGLGHRELVAAVIVASQKSLPYSIIVVSFLGEHGNVGLMTIPCIMGHLSQLFIDAYLSSRMVVRGQDKIGPSKAIKVTDATIKKDQADLTDKLGHKPKVQETVEPSDSAV